MDNSALEFDPYDYYKGILRQQVKEKSVEQIDALARASYVDEDANAKATTKIRKYEAKINQVNKKYKLFCTLQMILFVLAFIAIAFLILGIVLLSLGKRDLLSILSLVLGIVVPAIALTLIYTVLRKKVATSHALLTNLKQKHKAIYDETWNSLADLRAKLNFKLYVDFVNKLDSIVKLDYEVDIKKVNILEKLYDLNLLLSDDESIVDVYSGMVGENPFLRLLINKKEMQNHVYTGTRVVTWTETVRDSKGNTRTVTRSQTLVANVTAPVPVYNTYSLLIYGNGAAPNLNFDRAPSGLKTNHDDGDVKHLVNSRTKELEKMAEKAISDGRGFTVLANNEFDALFYATNRDNETEFRLLFTPLAQQNMVELMTAKDTFGDDFYFSKRQKINFISSYHSANGIRFDFRPFYNYYCYADLKNDYVNNLENSFYSLYFDLAPLLAIPLYQLNEAPILDEDDLNLTITVEEAEACVNAMDNNLFRHPQTATKQILKVKRASNYKNSDLFEVASHSYAAEGRITTIPVACSNGRIYDVAVNWVEYLPLLQMSQVAVGKIKAIAPDAEVNISFPNQRYHNFVGCYLGDTIYDNSLDEIFAKYINLHYNLL